MEYSNPLLVEEKTVGLIMPATQEIEKASHILSKIDKFPDFESVLYDHIQDEDLVLRKLDLSVKSFIERLEIGYEMIGDYVNHAKEHGRVDIDDPMVRVINDLEEFCSEFYESYKSIPAESFQYPEIASTLKSALKTYAGKFQELRWDVLIHNGRVAPRSNETFSGGDEFEAIVNR